MRLGAKVNDNTGTFLCDDALGAAAFVPGECMHVITSTVFTTLYRSLAECHNGKPSGEYLPCACGVNQVVTEPFADLGL